MITKDEYKKAVQQHDEAEKIMQQYHKESAETFGALWKLHEQGKHFFKEEELRYAAFTRCKCGAGLAYPLNCGGNHQWDCSALLKGSYDKTIKHDVYPFMTYEIKSENQPSANGATTREKK